MNGKRGNCCNCQRPACPPDDAPWANLQHPVQYRNRQNSEDENVHSSKHHADAIGINARRNKQLEHIARKLHQVQEKTDANNRSNKRDQKSRSEEQRIVTRFHPVTQKPCCERQKHENDECPEVGNG